MISSLNVNIMFLSSFTPEALSEGMLDIKDGALTSKVMKLSDVLFEIPTYPLPASSKKAYDAWRAEGRTDLDTRSQTRSQPAVPPLHLRSSEKWRGVQIADRE